MTDPVDPGPAGRPGKHRVRQSFERAAATYDSAATVQRRICRRLAESLPDAATIRRVLDAGCGTGHALQYLMQQYPAAEHLALDLSAGMLGRIGVPCRRLAGDLEHLPLRDTSLDLYWSSLAVQWCDLGATLREARRTLSGCGHLLLASLGPATFGELRQAFADVDPYRHTLGFHPPEAIDALAAAAGFGNRQLGRYTETAHYADFRSLLQAVKDVGANQVGDGQRRSLMGRAGFARAAAAYEQLRQPDGLPLTYDVILLHAQ